MNARNQITLWGPKGEIVDYARKQWAGLIDLYYRYMDPSGLTLYGSVEGSRETLTVAIHLINSNPFVGCCLDLRNLGIIINLTRLTRTFQTPMGSVRQGAGGRGCEGTQLQLPRVYEQSPCPGVP